ncbi:RIC1 superfamily domain-containing protein [Histoplasma ohiense]|nr:RIC1 superfamily domain-containing protein [Histoplasma ohiense (nom. inval.)]
MMEICLPLRCLVSQTWLPVTDTARNCVLFVLFLHGANSTTWNSYTRMFRSPLPVVPISDVALRFLKAARRRVWTRNASEISQIERLSFSNHLVDCVGVLDDSWTLAVLADEFSLAILIY